VLIEAAIFVNLLILRRKTMLSLADMKSFQKSFDPFSVGFFDELESLAHLAAKNLPKYPPYNIKQVSADKFVIEMAVAGFSKTDIDVTLKGNSLVVSGNLSEDKNNEIKDHYLYKGIADRAFTHEFKIADKVEIKNAELINGMLKIWLENMVKAQDAIKKITIKESKDE
jgi:molecular chaperone IbpA